MAKARRATVSLERYLVSRIKAVDRASRERDRWAEKRERERFSNLTKLMTAGSEAQAKAVELAFKATTELAKQLADATAQSTQQILTRLESIEKTLLTGSSKREGVEGWWTKARINIAAVIGFVMFVIVVGGLFWRAG